MGNALKLASASASVAEFIFEICLNYVGKADTNVFYFCRIVAKNYGKNVYTLVSPYNFASLPPISLIFKVETR